MDKLSEQFKDWLDANNLGANDVCNQLGISAGTLTQWRSRGVPERRHEFVRHFMAQWQDKQVESLRRGGSLTLEVDMETFENWNLAAMREEKTITSWAHDGLEAMAQEALADQTTPRDQAAS